MTLAVAGPSGTLSRSDRKLLALVLVVMVALGAVGVYSFYFSRMPSSGPQTATFASSNGLRLVLTANSTSIPFRGGIAASVREENTLQQAFNISASDNWPALSLNWGRACSNRDTVGIAVFQGFYTASNISGLTQVQVSNPYTGSCPNSGMLTYSYAFQPSSPNATAAIGCNQDLPSSSGPGTKCFCYPSPCPPLRTRPAITEMDGATSGYWFAATKTGTFQFQYFAPGVYTIVGGDEWGGLAILHFEVRSPGCAQLRTSLPFPMMQERFHGTPNTPGAWIFTVAMDSTVVVMGQDVELNGTLLDASNTEQTVEVVAPLLAGLEILRPDGTVAWQYQPPSTTSQRVLSNSEAIPGSLDIPTSQLQAGQTYTIVVKPAFYDQSMHPLWTDLTVAGELTVC